MRMRSRTKVTGLGKGMSTIKRITRTSTEKSMKDCMKDLERVASETTPFDEGDLEMGGNHGVNKTSKGVEGWVRFEAWNDNPNRSYDFNYAIWIHENMEYQLGEKSKKKQGGQGLSGKHYPVDRKYLTRPHSGEAPTYREIIENDLKKKLRG